MATLSQADKDQLKQSAQQNIAAIGQKLQTTIDRYDELQNNQKDLIPEMQDLDLDVLDGDSEVLDQILAKIALYKEKAHQFKVIQDSPYFLRIDLTWQDDEKSESIFISKYSLPEENIYSWFSPIASLRYAEIGSAEYEKPDSSTRSADINRKDDFIIQNKDIVFMTHEDREHERQVVFQKHLDERKEFLLPEIVAELDKLQDRIIRTSPSGAFLINGPAGSGKTTLALHRVAYLVLSPEFREYFEPEKIMVFVADEGAIVYFSQLLPELGIHGVKINTFNNWALMMVNSRYRAKIKNRFKFLTADIAQEFFEDHNPYGNLHPSLAWSEFTRYKQEFIQSLQIKEGSSKPVWPALKAHYEYLAEGLEPRIASAFRAYLKFQEQNNFLDEVDLIILLMSLENPIDRFTHVVVDEVQNWLPAQIEFLDKIITHQYDAITFIGDIRQKTKPFTVNSWYEIDSEFTTNSERNVELLKVYRNTRPILEHLADRGYDVSSTNEARDGEPVENLKYTDTEDLQSQIEKIINDHQQAHPGTQIGILAKYTDSLAYLGHLAFDSELIHTLTISEAQGLEFHTVVLLDPQTLETPEAEYQKSVGYTSADEYATQDKHLYYVAVTRAREKLIVMGRD